MTTHTFHGLGVSEPVSEALARRDIVAPFAIQQLVLPDALAGIDILAKSPTGSGKTLAFAIPIVERLEAGSATPSALVLVPTRELCSQVAEEFGYIAPAKGIKVAAVYGGTRVQSQARDAKGAHVLVATPGRLQDLIERKLVKLDNVTVLVLDEADRMLDMGFQPQVDKIVRRLPRNRQTMFFSATLDGVVGELAAEYTTGAGRYEGFLPPEDVTQVDHKFVPVTPDNKVEKLVEHLQHDGELTLVFVRTKRGADRLVQKLRRLGTEAVALHGDMNQSARERALARFESGKVDTMVATDVAARGLDLDHITHVVNFDPPEDKTAYIHRVGRTGRAGRAGTGLTFVLPDQQADVSRIAANLGHEEAFVEVGLTVAPPKLVYTSRRRNSKWGAPSQRRKI